jgi:hypothetical protein
LTDFGNDRINNSLGPGQGPEHGNEASGFIICGEFLEELREYQFLKKIAASRN